MTSSTHATCRCAKGPLDVGEPQRLSAVVDCQAQRRFVALTAFLCLFMIRAGVMRQLSAMRERLNKEQSRVKHAMKTDTYNMDVFTSVSYELSI